MSQQSWVALGYVSGVYGVRGWVRIFSYTRPRAKILDYQPWYLGHDAAADAPNDSVAVTATGREHGKGVVAKLTGVDDRDAAALLVGRGIFITRDCLPATESGRYYWADLIGLAVRTPEGELLGTVTALLETGAHDVLVLDGEPNRLIPFATESVVKKVDLDRREIVVDWSAAWWE